MLVFIVVILLILSLVYGFYTGNVSSFDSFLIGGMSDTVTLILSLSGSVCFFCGMASVAEKAGLTSKMREIASPFLKKLLPAAFENEKTAENVTLNLVSNLFGLGNAATPFGIKATDGMIKNGKISRSLALFILFNTSSLQIVPTTVIAVRQSVGASTPSAVILPVFLTQTVSAVFAVIISFALFKGDK